MKEYFHPVSGEACSRQRYQQASNVIAGWCEYHTGRPPAPGIKHCEECRSRIQSLRGPIKGPRQIRPAKESWDDVDWTLPNFEIAAAMKVSPSAVCYHRRRMRLGERFTVKGIIKPRKASVVHQPSLSHSVKAQARNEFALAVRSGAVRRKPCAVCDDQEAEGHHFDYTKPLEVIWLCKKHHGAVHRAAHVIDLQSNHQ